ncbi:BldC family transcriptional regulator [Nonomuraea sp. NPDC049400]|uniref:BldC family transcriptional regulator n=1 Tax=Nonomuraea sp. NPDC049400 TaxID=3364352 RepID=UPI0037BE1017
MTVAEALDTLHLLKPSEVAALFRVRVPTITRWANTGKLTCVRTLGGHRRYRRTEVADLLTSESIA